MFIKFYLHISPEEQLAAIQKCASMNPHRNWKISNSDYTEREYWPAYIEAYEDAMKRDEQRRMHPGTLFRQTISGFVT